MSCFDEDCKCNDELTDNNRKKKEKNMARKRTTKLEKLLKEMDKRGSMTHKEIVQFLLRGTGNRYNATTRKYYDNLLYTSYGSDRTRYGLLGEKCVRNADGSYSLASYADTKPPFTSTITY